MREHYEAGLGLDGVTARCVPFATPVVQSSGPRAAARAAWGRQRLADEDRDAARCAVNRDFDFMLGEWVVANRRLVDWCARSEPAQSDRWITFDSTHTCRPLLNGLGAIEEVVSEHFGASAALRLFDPELRRWAIYRLSSRSGALAPPLAGSFEEGVGVFVGEDRLRDESILVRHTWTRTSSAEPRCEQAYSTDGTDWRTTWIMEFKRVQWDTIRR